MNIRERCDALAFSTATYYRHTKRRAGEDIPTAKTQKKRSPRGLTEEEEREVMTVLTGKRFVDVAIPEVCATLLDEGRYICSERSMYRVMTRHQAVKERRNQLRHPEYTKPELLAIHPNQVWSWDITKLKGPKKWTYYYLYTVMDIYSRYVVGWMVAERESAQLAEWLIRETCQRQGIERDQLMIHMDRGSAMKSKLVAQLLADLGVIKSHSRPHVSNDNPYSESQFKTMKYRPDFPKQFGSIEDAKLFLQSFFDWYNNHHRHSGIEMMTPVDVHTGQDEVVRTNRQHTLDAAYARHPERFVKGCPVQKSVPREVWINKPNAA